MRWMFDTNTLVYVLNARPQHQRLLDRFNDHDPEKLCLSSITLAELRFGVAQGNDAALACGVLRGALQAEGQPIGRLDTLIAGHALSQGTTLVTNNLREFSRVKGPRLENWMEPS
jgi:tRNA(fMet)-specific endonuclease VapC